MNLKVTNENYCATIVKVHNIVKLDNCDNVVGFPIYGYQAIVSKDTQIGDLGILFTAEVQLSEEYCKQNNLFRHSNLNIDTTQKGYIEDNRRVKAVKFRGHTSSALFMPLSSLMYIFAASPENINSLFKEGDSFNEIEGIEICKKYVIKVPREKGEQKARNITESLVESKVFPQHFETDNYHKNVNKYQNDDTVIITQKIHGTSARFGKVLFKRQLTIIERILKWLGVKVQTHEYDYVCGSRRVIKDTVGKPSFYETDVWAQHLELIKHVIPEDYILYGEIVGYAGDKAIQGGYSYGYSQGNSELYIYRIAIVNNHGIACDLSWEQVKEFCNTNALKYVPELWQGKHKGFDIELYKEKILSEINPDCLPVDKGSPEEGICIRKDGIIPYVTKAKNSSFLHMETAQLDKGEADTESQESQQQA